MIVAYTELPDMAGGWPRPLLDVEVGGNGDVLVPCLVDTGALHTLLPRWVADADGIALDDLPVTGLAVAAAPTRARFTTVRLVAAGATWDAEVGFCDPWPSSGSSP